MPADQDATPPRRTPEERAERRARKRRARRVSVVMRWVRGVLLVTLVGALAAIVALALVLDHHERDLPSTADLKHYDPPQVTRVLARDGSLLAELFVERRTVVSIDRIPLEMKVAVLAAEDADFYRHEGLDYFGMLRALIVNLRSQSARQGGSTITQQVVKNALLTPERTFARKAREVLLARRIEQELTKDEILELYLNLIYFGHGRYGVEEASRYYFGKSIEDVTLAEAALLAGLPKGPSLYSPRVDFERARRRRDHVLRQVVAKGFATPELVEQALRQPIVLAPATDSLAELAPEVVAEVQRTLLEVVGPAAARGGYTVTTTIDPALQAMARKAVRDNLDVYAERHGLLAPLKKAKAGAAMPFQGTPVAKGHKIYQAVVTGGDDRAGHLLVRVGTVDGVVKLDGARRYNPKGLPPTRFAEKGRLVRVSPVLHRGVGPDGVPHEFQLELGPQSALLGVAVDSRDIVSLVGSYEAVRGGLDRATFARRQPGSSFKPVVFGLGIHTRRFTPITVIPGLTGSSPDAPLLLRDAVARSVNEAATWALRTLGAPEVVSWSHRLGVDSELGATESLALGAYEVTPRELAGVYAAFAGGGTYDRLRLIRSVMGPDGAEVALPEVHHRREVLAPAEAYVLTDVLRSVVERGTGKEARALGLDVAGKTGTSNEARDAWFAGYSPGLVCVVWTGYDDAVPLGRGESGARTALPTFVSYMKAAYAGPLAAARGERFVQPAGVVRAEIDGKSGLLAYEGQKDARTEVFVAGTEPTEQLEAPDAGADASAPEPEDAESPPRATVAPPREHAPEGI